MSIQEYSVSNRGLRSGLVGTPEHVRDQLDRFADAGVDLVLLQMSPQLEEMERFSALVINGAAGRRDRPGMLRVFDILTINRISQTGLPRFPADRYRVGEQTVRSGRDPRAVGLAPRSRDQRRA